MYEDSFAFRKQGRMLTHGPSFGSASNVRTDPNGLAAGILTNTADKYEVDVLGSPMRIVRVN